SAPACGPRTRRRSFSRPASSFLLAHGDVYGLQKDLRTYPSVVPGEEAPAPRRSVIHSNRPTAVPSDPSTVPASSSNMRRPHGLEHFLHLRLEPLVEHCRNGVDLEREPGVLHRLLVPPHCTSNSSFSPLDEGLSGARPSAIIRSDT